MDYVDLAINTAVHIHEEVAPSEDSPIKGRGHILIFMSGVDEIDRTCEAIRKSTKDLDVHALHASQSGDVQELAFRKNKPGSAQKRMCIVSTNVAETSLTLDGVAYVIDCGLVKRSVYNPRLHVKMLNTVRVSKASADQRKGRAGRTRPGTCYRLYSAESYHGFDQSSPPGIENDDLSSSVLKLQGMGMRDVHSLDWIDQPPVENVLRANELLRN
jgi:HrpA-like RNA helicase